jgi:hypothetical protein
MNKEVNIIQELFVYRQFKHCIRIQNFEHVHPEVGEMTVCISGQTMTQKTWCFGGTCTCIINNHVL